MRGKHGFGYDPVFLPAGSRKSAAQLSAARKDRISHRGQAARALAGWITTERD
jgi:XTP/dITP diphosphohydrolase